TGTPRQQSTPRFPNACEAWGMSLVRGVDLLSSKEAYDATMCNPRVGSSGVLLTLHCPSGMGVTLILTLDSLSPFAEGNDVPRQRHRPFVRLAQQRPGAFKALTLTQRPQGENRLPPSCTPAHPRTFQALAHQGFTRGFHDPRANRQVLRSQGRIAHPV